MILKEGSDSKRGEQKSDWIKVTTTNKMHASNDDVTMRNKHKWPETNWLFCSRSTESLSYYYSNLFGVVFSFENHDMRDHNTLHGFQMPFGQKGRSDRAAGSLKTATSTLVKIQGFNKTVLMTGPLLNSQNHSFRLREKWAKKSRNLSFTRYCSP